MTRCCLRDKNKERGKRKRTNYERKRQRKDSEKVKLKGSTKKPKEQKQTKKKCRELNTGSHITRRGNYYFGRESAEERPLGDSNKVFARKIFYQVKFFVIPYNHSPKIVQKLSKEGLLNFSSDYFTSSNIHGLRQYSN
jgi:hypothetical protein